MITPSIKDNEIIVIILASVAGKVDLAIYVTLINNFQLSNRRAK